MVKFFSAFHGMKDIITSIRSYIIHDFKQIAILVKTNEQVFVLVFWHKAVKRGTFALRARLRCYQRKRQCLEYIFLGYVLVL